MRSLGLCLHGLLNNQRGFSVLLFPRGRVIVDGLWERRWLLPQVRWLVNK